MPGMHRRNLVKLAGALPVLGSGASAATPPRILAIIEPGNAIAGSAPVGLALDKLRQALAERGAGLEIANAGGGAALALIIAAPEAALAAGFAPGSRTQTVPEQFRIVPGHLSGSPALLVAARDIRGFVYGLLELAERVQFGGVAALHLKDVVDEAPANRVRSVARAFCSEIEDKPWFYSEGFWHGYLDMLVACRFNRFNFSFGIPYDFPRGVTDDYFHFPYPYLVTVPGYDVRA